MYHASLRHQNQVLTDGPLRPASLHTQLWLPRPRPEIFAFFADAQNLQAITPPWLKFEILTPTPLKLGPGTLIDYRIRVHGVPLRWRSEITVWDPPRQFADVQVRGPYAVWQHTHFFEEQNGGTLCRDDVCYWPRGGWLANALFVRRDVQRIFRYREQRLQEIFKPAPAGSEGKPESPIPADSTKSAGAGTSF